MVWVFIMEMRRVLPAYMFNATLLLQEILINLGAYSNKSVLFLQSCVWGKINYIHPRNNQVLKELGTLMLAWKKKTYALIPAIIKYHLSQNLSY